jgi:hypothetical protein
MGRKSPWPTFQDWYSHGIRLNYQLRNSASISRSEKLKERSWYSRGERKKWIIKFKFKKKLSQRPRGFLSNMSNAQLLKFYHENYKGMTRSLVFKKDARLYGLMGDRGLREEIPLSDGRRPNGFFSKMSDTQLINFYHKNFKETGRTEIKKTDSPFYNVLRNRNLLDKISSKRRPYKFFTNMKDQEVLDYTYFLFGKDVKKSHISKKDPSLYLILIKRKMLNEFQMEQNPAGHYRDFSNLEQDLKSSITKNKGMFPSKLWFNNNGMGGLMTSISKYHNGISAVREKIGYNESKRQELALELELILGEI